MSSGAQKARERAESLLRAWDILQILRKTVEASMGEPVPTAGKKSVVEEGMLIAKHLAKHLATLHQDRIKAQDAVTSLWNFHIDKDRSVSTHSKRAYIERLDVKTEQEIRQLFHLPRDMADEIEEKTGRVLNPKPTEPKMR